VKTSRIFLSTVGAACLVLNAPAAPVHDQEAVPSLEAPSFSRVDPSVNLAAIPEPSVAVAIAGGLAILAGWRRLRR
jgi:hypothetical protein